MCIYFILEMFICQVVQFFFHKLLNQNWDWFVTNRVIFGVDPDIGFAFLLRVKVFYHNDIEIINSLVQIIFNIRFMYFAKFEISKEK